MCSEMFQMEFQPKTGLSLLKHPWNSFASTQNPIYKGESANDGWIWEDWYSLDGRSASPPRQPWQSVLMAMEKLTISYLFWPKLFQTLGTGGALCQERKRVDHTYFRQFRKQSISALDNSIMIKPPPAHWTLDYPVVTWHDQLNLKNN
jgi:hypothetical protein